MYIKASSNISDFVKYLTKVPADIEESVWQWYPNLRRNTRKKVVNNLTQGHGYDKGVYKKSIIQKNFAQDRSEISFIVGAKKPHYRLSHLLEHGHRVKVNGVFVKHIKTTGTNITSKIPHIAPGQEYADREVMNMYNLALTKTYKKFINNFLKSRKGK